MHSGIPHELKYGDAGKRVTVRLTLSKRDSALRGPACRVEVIDSRFFGSPYPALELMDCLLLRMRVVDAPKVPSQSIGLLNAWIQLKEQCYTMHLIACPLRWQLIQ